jgi:hypothetical protein
MPNIITTNEFINKDETIPYLSSSKLANRINIKHIDNFIKIKESLKKTDEIKMQIPDIISNRFI